MEAISLQGRLLPLLVPIVCRLLFDAMKHEPLKYR